MTAPKKPFYLTLQRWQIRPARPGDIFVRKHQIGEDLIVAECDTERELNAVYEQLRNAEGELNYQTQLLDEVLGYHLLALQDLEELKKRLGNHDIPIKQQAVGCGATKQ
jgi:hypothetical protein